MSSISRGRHRCHWNSPRSLGHLDLPGLLRPDIPHRSFDIFEHSKSLQPIHRHWSSEGTAFPPSALGLRPVFIDLHRVFPQVVLEGQRREVQSPLKPIHLLGRCVSLHIPVGQGVCQVSGENSHLLLPGDTRLSTQNSCELVVSVEHQPQCPFRNPLRQEPHQFGHFKSCGRNQLTDCRNCILPPLSPFLSTLSQTNHPVNVVSRRNPKPSLSASQVGQQFRVRQQCRSTSVMRHQPLHQLQSLGHSL